MFAKVTLVYLIFGLSLATGQELEHFYENSTMDFEKENVLADSAPEVILGTSAPGVEGQEHITEPREATAELQTSDMLASRHAAASEENLSGESGLGPDTEENLTKEGSTKTTQGSMESLQDQPNGALGETPPKITKPLSQERIVVTGKPAVFSINCSAEGNPAPTYQWYWNDVPIDDTEKNITIYPNGTLYFKEFREQDNGLYQCRAKNRHGISVSVKVPLIAKKEPGNIQGGSKEVKEYEGKVGEPLNIPCADTPQTVPEYIKRWYKKPENNQLQLDKRVSTDLNGTLRFVYLKESDSGSYECALAPGTALAGDLIKKYNEVNVLVSQGNTEPAAAPLLVYSSPKVKAVLGRKAVLECFFSRFPESNITWKNSSNHIIAKSDSRFLLDEAYFGRRLIIERVQEGDNGAFTCTANNGHGTEYGSVQVNVTAPPMKESHNGLDALTVSDDKDVTMKCKAKVVHGQHMDSPQWYRNGKPLNKGNLPDSTRYTFTQDLSELHIRNLNKDVDTASFQCNISNSEGYLFYDGYVRVIDAIKIVKRPESVIQITDSNTEVDISVHARGDSCCPINKQWKLNGNDLTIEHLKQKPFIWSSNGESLMFNTSGMDNQTVKSWLGTYTCRVSDRYQDTQVDFIITLNVTSTAAPLESSQASLQLWWIGLILGITLLVVVALIVIIFIKSNYPQNTYPLEKTEIRHHLNPKEDLLNQSFQEI